MMREIFLVAPRDDFHPWQPPITSNFLGYPITFARSLPSSLGPQNCDGTTTTSMPTMSPHCFANYGPLYYYQWCWLGNPATSALGSGIFLIVLELVCLVHLVAMFLVSSTRCFHELSMLQCQHWSCNLKRVTPPNYLLGACQTLVTQAIMLLD